MRALLLLLFASASFAQAPHFERGEVHGRDAYILDNGVIRVAALRGAGHIAELRFLSDDPRLAVNPMRVPHFPTIEPWEYDPAQHDAVYGGGPNKILQSGYMGHLMNFPTFGVPSPDETANGLGSHGEALAREWKLDRVESDENQAVLWYSAHLPKTQYQVGRALTIRKGESVVYFEEWVQSLTDYDRPAMWVEHVTFGPPFAEPGKTFLDMSATRGEVRRGGEETNSLAPGEVTWPEGKAADGSPTSLRPLQPTPNAGTYVGYRMDPARETAWFTMYNEDYRALVGYIWKTADFPWIGDWQENGRNKPIPWEGKTKARGMEIGTTPFGASMEAVVSAGPLWGTPTYRWIGGRQKAETRYVAFLLEIPETFRGVADVQVQDGAIVVVERGTAQRFNVRSGKKW
ncbi:MAG: hypothetical protein GC160_01980 [Acidobacteria bacterium]|nr:hypothetical protein [Acidobacteriota bacterium]